MSLLINLTPNTSPLDRSSLAVCIFRYDGGGGGCSGGEEEEDFDDMQVRGRE